MRLGAAAPAPPVAAGSPAYPRTVASVFPMDGQAPTLQSWLRTDQGSKVKAAVAAALDDSGDADVASLVDQLQVDPIALGERFHDPAPWRRTMRAGPTDVALLRRGIRPGQSYEQRYDVYRLQINSGRHLFQTRGLGPHMLDPMFVRITNGAIEVRAAHDTHRDEQIRWIEEHIAAANKIIEQWNTVDLHKAVEAALADAVRARSVHAERTAQIENAGFRPLPATTPKRLPLADRRLPQTRRPSRVATGLGQYEMQPDQFQAVMDCIARHQDQVERLPGAGPPASAGEEEHRDNLLRSLNMRFADATGEAFSKEGKTDIRVIVGDRSYFHAECKIWSGPSSVTAAVEQLDERYLIYRDQYGALIFFVRGIRDPQALTAKAVEHLVTNHHARPNGMVARFPVVRTPGSQGQDLDLAIVVVVVDSAPPRK